MLIDAMRQKYPRWLELLIGTIPSVSFRRYLTWKCDQMATVQKGFGNGFLMPGKLLIYEKKIKRRICDILKRESHRTCG